jgi:hypothetical protein
MPSRLTDERLRAGLTEDRIKGAIRTLEAVVFLDRAMAGGSTHQKTSDGELHRKPILFQIGSDYAPGFLAANRRAAAARSRHSGERRTNNYPTRRANGLYGPFWSPLA